MATPQADIALRNQVFVEGLKEGEAVKVASFLSDLDKAIRLALSGDELTDYSRKRLSALLDDVDAKLTKLHATFWTKLKASALDIAEYQAGFEAKALALSVTAPDFEAVVPTLAQIRSAIFGTPLSVRGADGGKLLEAFVRDWSAKEVKAVTGAIRRGVFEGQTNSDMVRAIRGTRAAGYKDGLLAVTDRQARAVVNTAVQHAATTARMEVAKRNADVVQSVQWLSTLDSHVCFVAGTPVETPTGTTPIELLKEGDVVIGGSGNPRRVLGAEASHTESLIRVGLSNGEYAVCTPGHLWLNGNGDWVRADSLTEGSALSSVL